VASFFFGMTNNIQATRKTKKREKKTEEERRARKATRINDGPADVFTNGYFDAFIRHVRIYLISSARSNLEMPD
jgi:bifunctional ADP-heptose synthase (sugar kinase/adenylyltransferase)